MATKADINGGRTHKVKCLDVYFDEVKLGLKRFEIRKNDRFYQCGDILIMERVHKGKAGSLFKTTQEPPLRFVVGPILQGGQFGIEAGYCAFSLFTPEEWEKFK